MRESDGHFGMVVSSFISGCFIGFLGMRLGVTDWEKYGCAIGGFVFGYSLIWNLHVIGGALGGTRTYIEKAAVSISNDIVKLIEK